MRRILFIILALGCLNCLAAQDSEAHTDLSPLVITPLAGFGFGIGGEATGLVWRAGSGFFLRADEKKQFGLIAAFIRYMPENQNQDFGLIGIHLRLSPVSKFYSSIGTVGYLGIGKVPENYFGVSTKLDYEIFNKVLIGFDTDFILSKEPFILNYLTLSFNF